MKEASWQETQRRLSARLTMGQARLWLLLLLIVWWFVSAWLFWSGLSAVGQSQIGLWVWSSVAGTVCPWCQSPYQGAYVNAGELARWLNATVYKTSLLVTIKEALWAGVMPTLACALAVVVHLVWPRTSEAHVRGTELVPVGVLQRRLTPWSQWGQQRGVKIAGVTLPRTDERSHFTVCGATGSGKTMTIRALLRQIRERGEPCIVVDPEQEFIQEFYNEQRGDWLLNPSDARCPLPSLWDEIAEEVDYPALANSLLPDLPQYGQRGVDLFFRESARTVFVALMKKIQTRDPRDICAALLGPPAALDALVQGTDAAPLLDKEAHQQRAGVLSTLHNAAKALQFLPPHATRTWSAREWGQQKEGWVFLSFRWSWPGSVPRSDGYTASPRSRASGPRRRS